MRLLIAQLSGYSRYITREFACIMEALIAVHGWKHLEPSELKHGSPWIEQLERLCGAMPDLILFWEADAFIWDHEGQVKSLPCEKWIVIDDLHHPERHVSRERAFLNCSTILATYAYRMDCFFPKVVQTRRVIWMPHSASPDFVFEANPAPCNAVFLSGSLHDCYPLRRQLNALSEEGMAGIVRQPHPGYRIQFQYGSDDRVGRAFGRRIWEHRSAFTDCSTFQYTIAKHFEIPATGALLVAEATIEVPLRELGFLPGIHYFPVGATDLEERVRYLLDQNNHAELDRIRTTGQILVRSRHLTIHRANLINDLAVETCGHRSARNSGLY